MKIKITRNTVSGGVPVFVGDVIDLDDREARYLIALGKAMEAPAEKVREAAVREDYETAAAKAPARKARKRK